MSLGSPAEDENGVSLGFSQFWLSGKSVIPACFWPWFDGCSPQAEFGLDPRLKHSWVKVLSRFYSLGIIFEGVIHVLAHAYRE